jgi:hypothetical protein
MSQEIRRRLAARTAGNRRPADTAIPNYGRGAERLGETESKLHVGRFSDGLDTGDGTRVGRYSDGAPDQPAA